jgi:predicted dehydrogenase
VELEVETSAQGVMGKIELSFTRNLRNSMRFYGEKGCLEAATVGANEVYFSASGDNGSPIILNPQNAKPRKRYDDFVTQLSTFANSINNNSKDYVQADEAIKSMAIIEECYRKRTLAAQPWEKKHLESFFENTRDKY